MRDPRIYRHWRRLLGRKILKCLLILESWLRHCGQMPYLGSAINGYLSFLLLSQFSVSEIAFRLALGRQSIYYYTSKHMWLLGFGMYRIQSLWDSENLLIRLNLLILIEERTRQSKKTETGEEVGQSTQQPVAESKTLWLKLSKRHNTDKVRNCSSNPSFNDPKL